MLDIKKMIDISISLSPNTIIYPGDPKPEYGLMFSLKNNDIANVGYIKTGIHHGTHVDIPYHFNDEGKKFHEMPIDYWVGSTYVMDLTNVKDCIRSTDLNKSLLKKYQRILFKTKNSVEYLKRPGFTKEFIYLDKSACELIVEAQVKTVGLDYITVDPYGSEGFPAHRTLLNNSVCIIESLNLDEVGEREYFLMCLPLKLVGTDGAPARALLLE